ncbi:MAG: hypothetical protein C0625_02545 [Arcobacter sp.]|nr:MAG: hypothetical protein C0625_02545 [Arcobacter sp.]
MMKYNGIQFIGKKVALFLAVTGTLFANVNVKSIDIFTNKSFVNQKINLTKNSTELLGQVRLEDIRFNLQDGCQINNVDIRQQKFENDELSLKITKLQNKINSKQNEIKALKSNVAFLERTSITNIADSKSLETTSAFIKKEILSDYNFIYTFENQLKDYNEQLNELIKTRTNTKFTTFDYDLNCAKTNEVSISYPIYNISRNGFYEIDYNSKSKNINIKNSSFITQSTGVDFKNIDINLYTYNYVQQLMPNTFRPEYLDIIQKQAVYESNLMMDAAPMKRMLKSKAVARPIYTYVEDTTKSFFKASNVSLVSGKKTEVVFAKDKYKANDSLEIDGYSSSQAFYKVDFKSKKLYGVLNSKLYLDGTFIGRNNLPEIKKDKKTSIYFGSNRFIDVKKELIKDMKEEPFFSLNKLKTQKIWKYKITNNQDKIQKITLLDRVPISKHEDIVVKLIGKSKETKLDKNGKIYFEFELKPNESKEIEFGYEIEKPAKK